MVVVIGDFMKVCLIAIAPELVPVTTRPAALKEAQ
jgi:hypothetical protein